jgi:S-DNA-T family DNA segregation ATPase FtsK/SpoIIIE
MKQKILKLELIILFTLSLVSVFYFFFGNHLPDNSLMISSQSTDYYTIGYYISSILAEVSFYVGPWIAIPFLLFSFIYSFILSSREKDSDVIVGLTITAFFFGLTFMVTPHFLGNGLKILSENYLTLYVTFFSTLALGVLMFYLTLRGAFFVILKRFQIALERIGLLGIRKVQQITNVSKKQLLTYSSKVKSNDLKEKTISMLKDSGKKAQQIKSKISSNDIVPNEITEITPRLQEIMEEEVTLVVESTTIEGEIDTENVSEGAITKQTEVKERKNSVEQKFFKSSDLIDCITAKVSHTQVKGPDDSYFSEIIRAIEEKLGEFKLDCRIINVLKGPVVDTFELEPGSGVKVSKVTGLSDDIGLALNGAPIRIVYPMRGRSTIGIEVPRNPRDFIFLDEVLKSKPFNDSNQRLPIAMGKDAFGEVKVVDLAGMPHMLVAGATGAGKSVFINSLLVSLIVKKSPAQLKLILIDPKQLELALFANLPHLMLPVITDPTSSAIALLWAVQEMDKRYTILKEMGVKNIEGFNKKVKTCDPTILFKINEYYEDREEPGYELQYFVVVIDEFADLILSKAGKEIETNVNRLAAKARAAGIHLVVATQRPSTDVVTGVVKANFPTRISFRVSTGHDSKTILDQYGAEKLLGKGDMLYKHGVDLLRMHSSFVEEDEVEGLIEKLGTISQAYNQGALDFLENGGDGLEDEDELIKGGSFTSGTSSDPMYQQALEVVMENGSASASMLQRRLRVGYNRAANLVEEMERNGIVGPAQGSKPRKVLARTE